MKKRNGWKPRCVGITNLYETGRPAKVFCNYQPRYLEHETLLTEELMRWDIPFLAWKRSILTDPDLRPDAQYENLMIEFDCGTEKRPQVMRQARRYRDQDLICVWVLPTRTRFEWIKQAADQGNTLVKLTGADAVYSLDGQETTIQGVCDLVTKPGR